MFHDSAHRRLRRGAGSRPLPMFATSQTAANALDMSRAKFLALVESGALPRPRMIGGLPRWDLAELYDVIAGDAVNGLGDVKW